MTSVAWPCVPLTAEAGPEAADRTGAGPGTPASVVDPPHSAHATFLSLGSAIKCACYGIMYTMTIQCERVDH